MNRWNVGGKMTQLTPLEIILEFEPIVKLVCSCVDCQFNLINSAIEPDRRMAACNLKQITIGRTGHCRNFEKIKDNNDTRS